MKIKVVTACSTGCFLNWAPVVGDEAATTCKKDFRIKSGKCSPFPATFLLNNLLAF